MTIDELLEPEGAPEPVRQGVHGASDPSHLVWRVD